MMSSRPVLEISANQKYDAWTKGVNMKGHHYKNTSRLQQRSPDLGGDNATDPQSTSRSKNYIQCPDIFQERDGGEGILRDVHWPRRPLTGKP